MASVSIGQMNVTAVFKKNTPIAQPGGGQKDNYVTIATVKANLRSKGGGRTLDGQELVINSSHELTVRWQSQLNQVTKTTKIIIGTRVFTIDNWNRIDEKDFWYKFQINESNETIPAEGADIITWGATEW